VRTGCGRLPPHTPLSRATRSQDGANIDLDAHRKGKCCVLKTSTRQTIFLPVPGLVEPDKLKPADLVGVNKDSYLILESLPAEFDSRVKAMEVDEKPTEQFNDVGGLEAQIQVSHSPAPLPCSPLFAHGLGERHGPLCPALLLSLAHRCMPTGEETARDFRR
jgi:hypothetical protein